MPLLQLGVLYLAHGLLGTEGYPKITHAGCSGESSSDSLGKVSFDQKGDCIVIRNEGIYRYQSRRVALRCAICLRETIKRPS